MNYPHGPGYKKEGTSSMAAEEMTGRGAILRERVVQALSSEPAGMTADEIATKLCESVLAIRPRCSELLIAGKIKETPLRRRNVSGKLATVLAIRTEADQSSEVEAVAEASAGSKFPLGRALGLARKFVEVLRPSCLQIEVVGSIRRMKPFVKDIELLIVSKPGSIKDPSDFFNHSIPRLAASIALDQLLKNGTIVKRPNVKGHLSWGDENKLALHVKSGIPIDFFFTTSAKWHNALVVRTGPKQSNQGIAQAAIDKGWRWHAYGEGFTRNEGKSDVDRHQVESEADVFHFVGLPFKQPEKR